MFRACLSLLGWERAVRSDVKPPIKAAIPCLEPLEDRIVPSSADLSHPFSGQFFSQDFQTQGGLVFSGDPVGEGKDALMGFSANGQWFVDPRSGRPFNPGPAWASASAWADIVVGDFNGDGKTDVAGFSKSGGWWVGISTGSTFITTKWAQWSPAANWQAIVVGDFNGDGKTDVAGLSTWGAWNTGLSTGSGLSTSAWGILSGTLRTVVVGDFNGDGKTDVAGFAANGTWWVGTSSGDGFNFRQWTKWSTTSHWEGIVVGDFNGDGKDDIAGLTTGDQWWVAQSSGGGFKTSYRGTWSGTFQRLLVGDFNGDGRDEIAAFGSDGTWWVGTLNGSRMQASRRVEWAAPSNWLTVITGDFNGDGKTDLAGLSPNLTWWIGLSTGKTFDTSLWSAWVKTDAQPLSPENSGWDEAVSKRAYLALPAVERAELNFNTALNFELFTQNYLGVLRVWTAQAKAAGATSSSALSQFIRQRLSVLFTLEKPVLELQYLGLTDVQYELLMIMNLVHGFYDFDTTNNKDNNLPTLLQLQTGDCSEQAGLVAMLAQLMGISGQRVSLICNFNSPQVGPFFAGHEIFYAAGLWVDAETNIAFGVEPGKLLSIAPQNRLQALMNQHLVFGFYNWYLTPAVRSEQLGLGQDGGIIAYFYPYYFAALGQGATTLAIE
jgi:hypothetical protein